MQGESPINCAIRELREETGIASSQFTEDGKVVSRHTHSIYVEYLCVTDWDKNNIVLQDGETSDYKWVERGNVLLFKKIKLRAFP